MKGYLGEFEIDIASTPYAEFSEKEWALNYIEMYGHIDGDHHKTWVLDQVARILLGTPVTVKEARWDNGQTEYRKTVGEPSEKYLNWVKDMLGDVDEFGEHEYTYDIGVAP